MATSNAVAVWEGKLRDGKGSFKAQSGVFSGSFSFGTRFEGKKGADPEERLAAAPGGWFSSALSAPAEKTGAAPTRLETAGGGTTRNGGGAPKVRRARPH